MAADAVAETNDVAGQPPVSSEVLPTSVEEPSPPILGLPPSPLLSEEAAPEATEALAYAPAASAEDPGPMAAEAVAETNDVAGPPPGSSEILPTPVDEPKPPGLDLQPSPLLSDKAAVALAPQPAFLPAEGGQHVPPPKRATLLPVPSATPCTPGKAEEAPAKAICKAPAVAGQDSSDDEAVVAAGLTNAEVAKQTNKLIVGLATDRRHVGISAFLLFALRYRLRVHVWFDTRCDDLLAQFAPWATESITDCPLFQAISCRFAQGTSLSLHGHALHTMNHWVASFRDDRIGSIPTDYIESLGEGASDTETTFYATYLSLSLHVVKTVANGDCGLDVMCLMLGLRRSIESRKQIRTEIAAFAFKHIANRALIAMMCQVGELTAHLGQFEPESAGANLMACPLQEPVVATNHGVVATNHGDGVCAPVSAGPPLLLNRAFSDEELSAITWKCRMVKSSPEVIDQMLMRLPEECIMQTVAEYRKRTTAGATSKGTDKKYFLLRRDAKLDLKMKAAEQFLEWSEVTFGTGTIDDMKENPKGGIPYGMFASYVRAHKELGRACSLSGALQTKNRSYIRILRLYRSAIQGFFTRESAVAEGKPDPSSESAVAEWKPPEVDPFAKFRYKGERRGSQYFSSAAVFQRDSKRRRALGGGRVRGCSDVREMLALWYSIIRHSVNVKVMCRFPKKVLLVKAQMIQEDYYVACIKNHVEPPHVQVDGRWLNDFLVDYRLSSRKPNRKFKVPRRVLAERLKIFWIVISKARMLIILTWGYDPRMRNIDQSPFHGNEAGSAESNTLALKGAPTVPLIENHAATRERWSLNSVTDSSPGRVRRKLPGFELMFKAEGKDKQFKLQQYVATKDLPFKVSAVTGPKGSYREHDILDFLEKWLEPWARTGSGKLCC